VLDTLSESTIIRMLPVPHHVGNHSNLKKDQSGVTNRTIINKLLLIQSVKLNQISVDFVSSFGIRNVYK
jgi:hypothetical protein